jgi:hypothetical protein
MRDGVDAPQLGARLGIVPRDEAAAWLRIAGTDHTLNDLAVDDERAARIALTVGPIGGGVLSDELPAFGIERNQIGIGGRRDQQAFTDRHVARGQIVIMSMILILGVHALPNRGSFGSACWKDDRQQHSLAWGALTSPGVADCGRQASGVPWRPVCRHYRGSRR